MFRRIDDLTLRPPQGILTFEGRCVAFRQGDSVAAALLAALGEDFFRAHGVGGSARAPYCMMGVCFECLAEIDGQQNIQTCLTAACDGMVVRRQRGTKALP